MCEHLTAPISWGKSGCVCKFESPCTPMPVCCVSVHVCKCPRSTTSCECVRHTEKVKYLYGTL